MTDQEIAKQIEFLAKENRQLRKSGCKLAEAALYVAREYDGVHRLMSAVSDWTMTIANEGGRGKRSDGVTVGDDDGSIIPVVTDPPESIWLVYGDLADDASHRECCESGEVTWCDCAVFGSDVRYVREDIVNKLRLEIEQLKADFGLIQNVEWISVADRLPEYKAQAGGMGIANVIVCVKGIVTEGMYCNGVWSAMGVDGVEVEYWAELPLPPSKYR